MLMDRTPEHPGKPRNQVTWLLSLINLCLLVTIIWQSNLLRRRPLEAGPPPTSLPAENFHQQMTAPVDGSSRSVAPPAPSSSPSETTHPALDWTRIESDDYDEYIANLRAIGMPEENIQAIVTAELRRSLAQERQIVLEELLGSNYWEQPDPEILAELERRKRELDENASNTLRALLGEDAPFLDPATEWRAAEANHRLDFLSDEKRTRTAEILLRYQEAEARTKELADGRTPDKNSPAFLQALEDHEKMQSLLWEVLTPAEFEEVEIRTSWTAGNLRRGMENFDATEEEFRAIFRAWRAHDTELALIYATAQPDPGNDHVFDQIRQAIGEERYHRYRETWWK